MVLFKVGFGQVGRGEVRLGLVRQGNRNSSFG